MRTFNTEAQMSLQTLAVGQSVQTRGRNSAGDGLGATWLIQASGIGVDLDGGGVAVLQGINSEMLDYEIVTTAPTDVGDTANGHIWLVVDP